MSTVNHFPGHHVMKQVSNSVGGYSNNSNMNYKVIPTSITLEEDGSVINLYLVYIKHLGYINMLGYIMRYNTGEDCQATSSHVPMGECSDISNEVQPKSAFSSEYDWYYHNFVTDDDINDIMLIEGKLYTKNMLPLYIHSLNSVTTTNGTENLAYVDVTLRAQDSSAELHVFVPTYKVGLNNARYLVTYDGNTKSIRHKDNHPVKISTDISDTTPLDICGYVESSTDIAYALLKNDNKFELYRFDKTVDYSDILRYPGSDKYKIHRHYCAHTCPVCNTDVSFCDCGYCKVCERYIKSDGRVDAWLARDDNIYTYTEIDTEVVCHCTKSNNGYLYKNAVYIKEAIPRKYCCLNCNNSHFNISESLTTNTTLTNPDGETFTTSGDEYKNYYKLTMETDYEVSNSICPLALRDSKICKCGYCPYCDAWHDPNLCKKFEYDSENNPIIPNEYYTTKCEFPNGDGIHRFIYDANGVDLTQFTRGDKTKLIYICNESWPSATDKATIIVPNLSNTVLCSYIVSGLYCRCGCPLLPTQYYNNYYGLPSTGLLDGDSYKVNIFINNENDELKHIGGLTLTNLGRPKFIDIPAYSNNLCKQPDNLPAPGRPLVPV